MVSLVMVEKLSSEDGRWFKGHNQLWDSPDQDTSLLTLKRVHLNLKSEYI